MANRWLFSFNVFFNSFSKSTCTKFFSMSSSWMILLVGSHLLWHLLQEEKRVVALMRYTSSLRAVQAVFASYTNYPELFLSRIDWRVAAVNNPNALEKALDGVTEVFHCAAVVSLGGTSNAISDVNVEGTRLLQYLS